MPDCSLNDGASRCVASWVLFMSVNMCSMAWGCGHAFCAGEPSHGSVSRVPGAH